MDNKELAQAYLCMVNRHSEEALKLTTQLAAMEMTDEVKEIFYEVSNYGKSMNTKTKLAQYFYNDFVKDDE
jgi:hypothetical protein